MKIKKKIKEYSYHNYGVTDKKEQDSIAERVKRDLEYTSAWHTETPKDNGYYICKVYYKDIPNDMRILEWVGRMNCFCLPGSEYRSYHFFIGKDGGEDVEVVYEWMKLDLPFRMEKNMNWVTPPKDTRDFIAYATPMYANKDWSEWEKLD